MASIRKRGQRWYAEVRKTGHYETGTFRTKTQARVWAERVEDDIERGRPRGAHTLMEAMRRYARDVSPNKRGARWEQIRLKGFERLLPFTGEPIESVTPAVIAEWRDSRLKQVKASSCRREMILLTSVFEQTRREWQWISINPMRDVKKPGSLPARQQLVSDAQARALFEKAGYVRGKPPMTRQQLVCAAFDFALETAMRAGEIRTLEAYQIFITDRFVRLDADKTKTGTARDVPLSKGAVDILKGLSKEVPFPLSAQQLDANFRKLRTKAGMAGEFTFHDARASATTRLARKLDINDLARMTGHTDLNTLKTYYREPASAIARRLDDG